MVDGRLMTLGGIRVGGVQKEGTSAYPALLLAARWLLLVLLVLLARWLAGSLARWLLGLAACPPAEPT